MSRPKGSKNKVKDIMKQEINQDEVAAQALEKFAESASNTSETVGKFTETDKNFKQAVEELAEINKKEKEQKFTCIPPKNTGVRNKFGLLENISYVFDKQGFVSWRSMLLPEHLVLNRQKKAELEKLYKKSLDDIDIVKDKVDDKYILILLAGIRYLAFLRGFRACSLWVSPEPEEAVVCCRMLFSPNYETNDTEVEFESTAVRSKASSVPPYNNHLVSLAENAAFSRCVRNFLRITLASEYEIIGIKDEVPTENNENISPASPTGALDSFLKKNNSTFTKLREKLIAKVNEKNEKVYPEAEKWEKLSDVPPKDVLKILSALQSNKEKNGTTS